MTIHERESQIERIEKLIFSDRRYFFTAISYLAVIVISVNLIFANSSTIGAIASLTFFVINGAFLAHSFFEREKPFLRWLLGSFLLITFLGLVGWIILIIHNLNITKSSMTLLVVATICSSANRLTKKRRHLDSESKHSSPSQTKATPTANSHTNNQAKPKNWIRYASRLTFLFLEGLLTYMVITSRANEVYTVWEVMHPAFMPMFFFATFLLIVITISSEKIEYKLSFVIIHSILLHSFFFTIFPAGNIGPQQSVLGITRRIYDNTILHGWGGTTENIVMQVYHSFGGMNFQSVYSVLFARMFAVDVFWSHLLLAPTLWGIFIPTITFMITKTLGGNEKVSALASLLASAFPLLVYFGTISVPNSIGYVFFLASIYFFLKHITSPKPKYIYLMLIATFTSFTSHFLTGLISLSMLLLALSLKKYEKDKKDSPFSAKFFLSTSFILSASILPLALVYHRIFSTLSAYFSLDRIYEYTIKNLLGQFLLGEYFNYPPDIAVIHIAGPLIGFIWMTHILRKTSNQKVNRNNRVILLLFFLGYLMLWLDYRILKLFMLKVPFDEERIWVFRDFLSIPFVAFAINDLLRFFHSAASKATVLKPRLSFLITPFLNIKKSSKAITQSTPDIFLTMNLLISAVLAGWVTLSVNYAYPHFSPLQTTSYELEAVKYIHNTTDKSYVVICDQWISFAGQMIVGAHNQKAYYFGETDPRGVTLFTKMKDNASREVMTEAMNYTNATVAYFIIIKPRLGAEEYDRIAQQVQQNGIQTYKIFYYLGKEKLRTFYYEKSTD